MSQTDAERHSLENGLWLCENCASLIDKNKGVDFPVSLLKIWKKASEAAAQDRLFRLSESVRDNCVSSLIFMNIPRLHHLIALTKQPLELPTYFDDGIPGEGYIAPELNSLRRIIAQMRFPALQWQEAIKMFADPTGLVVSFEGRFRTRNGPKEARDRSERDISDIENAPQIYAKSGNIKFVMPYDPRFLTTATAGVEMRRGSTNVGGFASIKYREDDVVVASPFIIGLYSTPEARAFMNALVAHQRAGR
ncbi:hypothetical protein J3E64_002210 [Sphingobium sp. OAS761]|uniref:hypothetical protein n=1 Tax=Sphingobium sp. OAS761 TaxID=2817901 RepID=UPI00209E2317|nr:hypothetical protein [Sphingobium sp. OAS761]MCP1470522.1 hypothetical protein [Sphingobium sp. OAS761]